MWPSKVEGQLQKKSCNFECTHKKLPFTYDSHTNGISTMVCYKDGFAVNMRMEILCLLNFHYMAQVEKNLQLQIW
jgi:hypothetical protein